MKEIELYNIAILVTCYNRKQKTLAFLNSLINQELFKNLSADIYLLDDGSTDGLSEEIAVMFPDVKIIAGTGNLFWAGGMRTVWKYAMQKKAYDLFWLFNDDVVLFDYAVEKLLKCYQHVNKEGVILVGSTLGLKTNRLSYGGHTLYNMRHSSYYTVQPDDEKPLPCHLGNANIMLVDAVTVAKIGIFNDVYIHAVADYDYTLTAYKAGIDVLVAPQFYGYCEDDHGVNWLSGKYTIKQRINYLYSPKGLAYKEYLIYIKKFFPLDYFKAFAKLWLKTFFPIIWDKFKKHPTK
ncbi:GT2 family glycosyltransferase [Mucilaginibacter yixingensis]|uniref:GT2 family glycosyltransferase n=1 Tax=Mucilaginibacter yixingensis TaxID=1295612 RepID=A0A2T5JC52_9SPHI|nr:glycosyltransferase family 2 protein [Mucilaginibacter yixingensis]PTQ99341.1 GT2 family glycosyltransferase [Mucilaginibacter yixingensis]